MLQRHILYVAKTYTICRKEEFICCKDKIYVLQRQNLYVIKTKLYVIETTPVCCKDKIYM